MKFRAHFFTGSGSALLMSLWALLMLSAIVFAWAKFIDANMKNASEENFGFQARALAHSGVRVAMNAAVKPGSPLLEQNTAPDHGYQVTLTAEDGRLNLNLLLQGALNRDGKSELILRRYLELRGLKNDEVQTLIDSLLVWVDPNKKPHGSGAQDSDTYHPPHLPLSTLEEIKQVSGAEPLVTQSGWSDDLTLWSLNAKINLHFASAMVIQSLPTRTQINAQQAQALITLRAGNDKIDGSLDDPATLTVAGALTKLGINPPETAVITPLVSYEVSGRWRAKSVGKTANRTRQVEAVFTKAGATGQPTPQTFLWKEF